MAPSSCPHPVHSFAEVLGVECRGGSTLELTLKNEQLVLHSVRAGAIKAMVELFLSELQKASVGREGPRGAERGRAGPPLTLQGALSGLVGLRAVSQGPPSFLGWGWAPGTLGC